MSSRSLATLKLFTGLFAPLAVTSVQAEPILTATGFAAYLFLTKITLTKFQPGFILTIFSNSTLNPLCFVACLFHSSVLHRYGRTLCWNCSFEEARHYFFWESDDSLIFGCCSCSSGLAYVWARANTDGWHIGSVPIRSNDAAPEKLHWCAGALFDVQYLVIKISPQVTRIMILWYLPSFRFSSGYHGQWGT